MPVSINLPHTEGCANKKPRTVVRGFLLFLGFLVFGLFLAPFAKLQKLDFSFDFLLVLAGPVVNTLTGSAGEFYESVLRHGIFLNKRQETIPEMI